MVSLSTQKLGSVKLIGFILLFIGVILYLTLPFELIGPLFNTVKENLDIRELPMGGLLPSNTHDLVNPRFDVYMCPIQHESESESQTQSMGFGTENTKSDSRNFNSCQDVFVDVLSKAKSSIRCALYELDDERIVSEMNVLSALGVDIEIVIDDNYLEEDAIRPLSSSISLTSDEDRGTRYNNYMHHKFCVVDEKTTLISSANPTENGLFYNDNNILVFESSEVSQVFLEEFEQLKRGDFGYNKDSTSSISSFDFINSSIISMDIYMCPQDNCEEALVRILDGAHESIYFASFVMTLDSVEEILIAKAQDQYYPLDVQGVIESRSWNSQGSIAEEMSEIFDLRKDKNPKTMHHKFFVVDNRYVITGSMNPSSSGVNYNDENLIIIESTELALLFQKEFHRLQ